ncbi:cAMP and cAMP-inhibited cGMP 3',5'-cyclic phosphodiesterase 10A-like [Saccoglossus kowalevskii]|uniref:cAMP and cAMP-inhibited cGMP 3',5'-cyclic phosphodiesterase 10A-like n=1 Tax=Saccoglossus kowalevskii TaxID=10224 RepID=A0ABM0MC12_SACKO|nr:PREDICTED: cAMP and cAMP-inhibited cGMP 3',5'-cyclic phosphodiesterase 10A-like [Saccoglossus kowalevskii]
MVTPTLSQASPERGDNNEEPADHIMPRRSSRVRKPPGWQLSGNWGEKRKGYHAITRSSELFFRSVCLFLLLCTRPCNLPLNYVCTTQHCFDHEKLVRFTLSVRKNYHKVPYHNWWHAFNVAHCMYRMLDHEQEIFTELERQALIIACICHDLDHRGYTNQFMVKYETALASLYSTSVMEQHHFNQTVTILQQDGHNIFDHLTSDVYKQVLGYIRHYILATDLAQFFSNHKQVTRFCADQTFNIENTYHRNKLQAIMMSACDLSACAKTWPVQKKTVEIIYEEFYAQGDLEKKKGGVPLPMMDRDNAHNLPKEQVNFLRIFCEPLYGTLAVIFPHLSPLLENTKDNIHKWDNLAHGRPTTMWEVETSRIEKD